MCWTQTTHFSICDLRPLVGLPSGRSESNYKMVDMVIDPWCAPKQCIHIVEPDSECNRKEIRRIPCQLANESARYESCPEHKLFHSYTQIFPPRAEPSTKWRKYPSLQTTAPPGPRFSVLLEAGKALATLAQDLHVQNTRLNANSEHNTSGEPRCVYTDEQRASYLAMHSAALKCWFTVRGMIELSREIFGQCGWEDIEEWLCLNIDRSRVPSDISTPLARVPDCCLYARDSSTEERALHVELSAFAAHHGALHGPDQAEQVFPAYNMAQQLERMELERREKKEKRMNEPNLGCIVIEACVIM